MAESGTARASGGERPASETGEIARMVELFERGERFLIAMHEFPDGDALGSALALALALERRGKRPLVYSPQGAPQNLRFLPGARRIVNVVPREERFDGLVACDAGELERLGPGLPDPERRGTLVNLDHHPRNRPFGDINLVDPKAAAVGVLVHRVLNVLGQPLDREIATCLWVSLICDTGNFRHSNTNSECMRLARDLVELGVRPGEVTSSMYESQPLARVRLLAEVLQTLSVASRGRIAWVTASREVFERAGSNEETADGFISYPRSIAGVEVALLFREETARHHRVSFRSRGKVDVGAIATRFGGGGHHNAAGCAVDGSLDEIRAIVLREVEKALDRYNG